MDDWGGGGGERAQLVDGGDEEGERLAGAGLCLGEHVPAGKRGGEGGGLDGGHGGEGDGREEAVVDLALEVGELVVGQVDGGVGARSDGLGRPGGCSSTGGEGGYHRAWRRCWCWRRWPGRRSAGLQRCRLVPVRDRRVHERHRVRGHLGRHERHHDPMRPGHQPVVRGDLRGCWNP
ncbi:hypothetical protein L1887_54824 [Cichorium endivia]|nr:hypothetical protein L1887_54824 [Cichorium endivia]